MFNCMHLEVRVAAGGAGADREDVVRALCAEGAYDYSFIDSWRCHQRKTGPKTATSQSR